MATTLSTSGDALHELSIIERARQIAALFEYTDDDVGKCVTEFVREMSMQRHVSKTLTTSLTASLR